MTQSPVNLTNAAAEVSGKKPLECGFCGAKRWNDESVNWIPLRGEYRKPYCANTCTRWVMTSKNDYPNEVVLPELFAYTAKLEEEIRNTKDRLKDIEHLAGTIL